MINIPRPSVRVVQAVVAAAIGVVGFAGLGVAAHADEPASPVSTTMTTLGGPAIPATGVLLGDTEDGHTPGQTIAAMQDRLGRSMAMARVYSLWDDVQPTYGVTQDIAQGVTPLVSITPKLRNGTIISWQSIASGAHDSDIRAQALGLKATGRPVVLAFHHEANLSSGYGTAAQFVSAFREFSTVVRSVNAPNIALSVILTPYAYQAPAPWYPGSDYVDWVGADAYNFGACSPGRRAWQSLHDAAQSFYTFGAATGKPLVLAEWGAPEDPTDPTRRAQWLTDAGATFSAWPALKAAIYFNQTGSCDWHLGTTGPSADAFAALAHTAAANGLATARLATSATSVGPAPLSVSLDGSGSTGSARPTGQGVASWTLDYGDGSSTSGTGNPGQPTHTYPAGTWTATLSITDWLGYHATATTTTTAAAAPTITQGPVAHPAPGTVDLPAWIQTNQLTGTYYLQWGPTPTYGHTTAATALPAKTYQQTTHTTVTGLRTGQRYYWQIVATTPAGTALGHATSFIE